MASAVVRSATTNEAEPSRSKKKGKKSKRSVEQRGARASRKAVRMAERRAARNAAAKAKNEAANPKRKISSAEPAAAKRPDAKAQEPARAVNQRLERLPRAPAPKEPVGLAKPERRTPKKPASPATRVAIALLLAVGLLVGFWLLFRLPAANGQH